jgi:hypothetical protein
MKETKFLLDEPDWINDIIRRVQHYTLTSPERIAALCHAVAYIVRCDIPGDFVECGVWRGGSIMAMIGTLARTSAIRDIHLFDTFAGMTNPADVDVNFMGQPAGGPRGYGMQVFCPRDEVRANVLETGYPAQCVHLVEGRVEDTLPRQAPAAIALMRLDTDWYESTAHEMAHLWPRLSKGGVVIVDDYGHWQGARKAVDEYIERERLPVMLNRIDYTGRLAIKI